MPGAPSARAGETAVRPDDRGSIRIVALLVMAGLVGCGPSDAECQAAAAQLAAERARLERQLAEQDARVRLLREQLEQEREAKPEQVPSKYGPGDFPTRPRPQEWGPGPDPGQQPPTLDPRPPFHGR